jgi:hypothetical protein
VSVCVESLPKECARVSSPRDRGVEVGECERGGGRRLLVREPDDLVRRSRFISWGDGGNGGRRWGGEGVRGRRGKLS